MRPQSRRRATSARSRPGVPPARMCSRGRAARRRARGRRIGNEERQSEEQKQCDRSAGDRSGLPGRRQRRSQPIEVPRAEPSPPSPALDRRGRPQPDEEQRPDDERARGGGESIDDAGRDVLPAAGVPWRPAARQRYERHQHEPRRGGSDRSHVAQRSDRHGWIIFDLPALPQARGPRPPRRRGQDALRTGTRRRSSGSRPTTRSRSAGTRSFSPARERGGSQATDTKSTPSTRP